MAALQTDPWAVPGRPPRRPVPAAVAAVGLGLLAASGAAVLLARNDRDGLAVGLVAFGLLGAGALWSIPVRRLGRAGALAIAALAVAVATPSEARSSLVFVAVSLVAAVSAASGRALVPWLRERRPPVAGLSLGLVLASQVSWYRRHVAVALGLVLVSLVLGEVARHRPRWGAAVDAGIGRVVAVVVHVVGMVVVFVAALVTLYLPGLVLRGFDVVTRRSRRRSGWVPHPGTPAEAKRDEPMPFSSPSKGERRRRYATGLSLVLLLVPVAVYLRVHRETAPSQQAPGIVFPDFAYPEEPWVDDLYQAGFNVQFHPSLGWKARDVESRYLQVRNGVRRSWTPEDPTLDVWFVGGSALWGLGQRDDQTIPSEIAKRAADAGIRIRAVNLGAPGYSQWQEQGTIGNRLSRGERPDLIVVYDGANDLTGMIYRAQQGIEPLDEPPNRFHAAIEEGTHYFPEDRGDPASDAQLRRAFRSMYGAGVDLLARTAGAYGVPVASYWQPQYLSTKPDPEVDGPLLDALPWLGPDGSSWERQLIADVRAQLPDGVVDLGSALDDAGRVTWFDPVHTNEAGVDLIADAMWTTLRPTLEALDRGN